jgi:predicted amidohydrolase
VIKVGIAQIKNSTDIESNYQTIMKCLTHFEEKEIDLILFPECSLSGFSSKIKDCTIDLITPYLDKINDWSRSNNIAVVLPTALKDNEKIYNTGFYFKAGEVDQFFKIGLTESEKQFFSIPVGYVKKIYQVKSYRFIPLICLEAELEPFQYFSQNEIDFILWPGYWGWELEDKWDKYKRDKEENLIHKNVSSWSIPLLQANFSYNDFGDRASGPHGLSVVVNKKNELVYRSGFETEECFVVEFKDKHVLNVYNT